MEKIYISYNLTSSDYIFNLNGAICVLIFVKNNQSFPLTGGISGWISSIWEDFQPTVETTEKLTQTQPLTSECFCDNGCPFA